MDCVITSYKDHQMTSVETRKGFPLESVKQDAFNWVDAGLADRIEVTDMEGKLIFHHPRVTRPA